MTDGECLAQDTCFGLLTAPSTLGDLSNDEILYEYCRGDKEHGDSSMDDEGLIGSSSTDKLWGLALGDTGVLGMSTRVVGLQGWLTGLLESSSEKGPRESCPIDPGVEGEHGVSDSVTECLSGDKGLLAGCEADVGLRTCCPGVSVTVCVVNKAGKELGACTLLSDGNVCTTEELGLLTT